MPRINQAKLLKIIHSARPRILLAGFEPDTGDCANIVVALKQTIGTGNVECSWEDEIRQYDGEPAHCALRVNGILFDLSGRITSDDLRKSAQRDDDPLLWHHIVSGPAFERNYRSILDNERVAQIKAILEDY